MVPGGGQLAGGVDVADDDVAEADALVQAAEAGPQDGLDVAGEGVGLHGAAVFHDGYGVGVPLADLVEHARLVVVHGDGAAVAVLGGVVVVRAADNHADVRGLDGRTVGVGNGVRGDVGEGGVGILRLDGVGDALLDVDLLGGIVGAGGIQAEIHVGLPGADDDDLIAAGGGDLQGQEVVLVLQHDHALVVHLVEDGQALGGLVVDAGGIGGLLGVDAVVGRLGQGQIVVKFAGGDTGGHQTVQGDVHGVLREQALVGLDVGADHAGGVGVVVAGAGIATVALQVLAVGQGARQTFLIGQGVAGAGIAVIETAHGADGVAVGGDVAAEAVGLAQHGLHQIGAVGAGLAVQGAVGSHDRGNVCGLDDAAVGRQVVVAQGVQAGGRAAVEAVGLCVVRHIVLDGGVQTVVAVRVDHGAVLVLALQAEDVLAAHLDGQIGVLGIGFLVAAPAGITLEVDRRGIEVQIDGVAGLGAAGRTLADLVGDLQGFLIVQIRVPGVADRQALRIGRGVPRSRAAAADGCTVVDAVIAVQALVPPVVLGEVLCGRHIQRAAAQCRGVDRRRRAGDHLRALLRQRHAGDQIGRALGEAVLWIFIDGNGGVDCFLARLRGDDGRGAVRCKGNRREHAQEHHNADKQRNHAGASFHILPPKG